MKYKVKSLKERFQEKAQVNPHDVEGCWAWSAHRNKDGYGCISAQGKWELAHRISHSLFKGPIPEGMLVLHTCDNPPCTNPEHLFPGTRQDNMDDMAAKGRSTKGIPRPKRKPL